MTHSEKYKSELIKEARYLAKKEEEFNANWENYLDTIVEPYDLNNGSKEHYVFWSMLERYMYSLSKTSFNSRDAIDTLIKGDMPIFDEWIRFAKTWDYLSKTVYYDKLFNTMQGMGSEEYNNFLDSIILGGTHIHTMIHSKELQNMSRNGFQKQVYEIVPDNLTFMIGSCANHSSTIMTACRTWFVIISHYSNGENK